MTATVSTVDTAPEGTRYSVTVFLKSGTAIYLEARAVETLRDVLTGELRGLNFTDAVGQVPIFLDVVNEIAAVTRYEPDETGTP